MSKLCLGTVQFGLPYGVTNKDGQVPEVEVCRIMDLAAASGIELLDTAQAYGSAEEMLGRCWPTNAKRRLISKLPAGAPRESWEKSLIASLQKLKASSLDGFLLHRASDLLAPDGVELLDWLEGLRDRGLVERIGVSIYESSDLEGLPLDRLQLVQLPLSVYDQRLLRDGTVGMLQDLGISVHVRSVLMQGLLLQSPQNWPSHFSPGFKALHSRWLECLQQEGLTPLVGALEFVRNCVSLEAVVIGVLSSKELHQVLQVWNHQQSSFVNTVDKWSWDNRRDLDPRCWPKR